MGRAPCCDKANVKRGPWSPDEDATLKNYLHKYGTGGNWISLPQRAGLKRCGKSCRLRWLNYLRPDIKHGSFTEDEDNTIISLYSKMGSRWSVIAANLPGRTDNDVKNHWNTKLKKKLFGSSNNNTNNNKSNSLITPKIANLFTNDTTNHTIIQQPSSSTPTPCSSSPSPNYVVNYPDYHQFYTPIPSFSSLLSQCSNNTPISFMSNLNSLTNFDHIYANHDQVCSSVSSCQTPLKQELMPSYTCSIGPVGNLCSNEEVSSMSELSTNLYGSSLGGDHQLLDELGFGFDQDVLVTSNCNYGGDGDDQVDINPQGLGQDLTN